MYKIEVRGKITQEALSSKEPGEVEALLRTEINKSFVESIDKKLDDFSFIDLEPDEETGDFNWTADVVLCANSQVAISIQMVVQNLMALGLTGEQVGKILAPLQENMDGW